MLRFLSASKQALAAGRKLTIFRVVAVNIGLYDLKIALTLRCFNEYDGRPIEHHAA